MEPLNYAGILGQAKQLVPDYMQRQLGKQQAEANIRAQEVDNDAKQISLDAERQFQTGLTMLERDPTPGNIAAFARAHPQHAKTVLGAFEMQDQSKRASDFRQMGQAYAAANNGRVDLASNLLRTYRDAPGGEGEEDAMLDSMIEAFDSGDPTKINQAKARMGYTVALLSGVDKFAETMNAHDGYTVNPGDVRYDAFNNPVAAVQNRAEVRTFRDGDREMLVSIPGAPPITLPMGGGLRGPAERPAGPGAFERTFEPPSPMPEPNGIVATPEQRAEQERFERLYPNAPAPTDGPLQSRTGVPLTATRGVRNNNPGNLEDGAFARRQPGYVGSDGRFAIFEDAASGIRAQERLLGDHYFGRGINTVRGIVAKYAPASDGNDVSKYAEFIAKRAGVSPTEPITDPATQRKVSGAMRMFESRYEKAEVPAIEAQLAGASSSGVEVLAVGAPKPKFTLLSPTEVAATPGLDPTRAYQRSPDGRVTAIAGAPRRAARGGAGGRRATGGGRSSVAGVIAPIVEKVARGQTLTSGERTALNWYKSRSTRSTRDGGGQGGEAQPAPSAPAPKRARGPDGRVYEARGGQWVPVK